MSDQQPPDKTVRLSIDILKNDADLALTFTDSARLHSDPDSARQNIRHARQAYDFIAGMREEVSSVADTQELESKLAMLRKRLEDLGEMF